jgi:hypothetical protein
MVFRYKQGKQVEWDDSPDIIRIAIEDYLMNEMVCKVREKDTFRFVNRTNKSPNTVNRFLSALKWRLEIAAGEEKNHGGRDYLYLRKFRIFCSTYRKEFVKKDRLTEKIIYQKCSGSIITLLSIFV